jgi:hypothetical protein
MALARTLFACLFSCLGLAGAQAADPLAWRDADSLDDLIGHLETWLDGNTDLPRRDSRPVVRWASKPALARMSGSHNAAFVATVRGLYDSEAATIWLARPWSARSPDDVGVLLHELVHHRQAGAGQWFYCPGAQELPAYRAQEAWLAGLGLELDVNWIAIVLESGCTPRDIHPD